MPDAMVERMSAGIPCRISSAAPLSRTDLICRVWILQCGELPPGAMQ
jgi:hypothetical protein